MKIEGKKEKIKGKENSKNKTKNKCKVKTDTKTCCWKKKSILFQLEYLKYLNVQHVSDVMHIENNVCDSIIDNLLTFMIKLKMDLLYDWN